MYNVTISKETLDQIALTEEEYSDILRRLDREPNPVELGMFGALWSEHCGYKHSKQLIRTFPSESPASSHGARPGERGRHRHR